MQQAPTLLEAWLYQRNNFEFVPSYESITFALFVVFAVYLLFRYLQCQIQRLKMYTHFICLHPDSKFIYNIESCPICLNEFKVPIRVSCGHAFCIQCLLNYFEYNAYCWKCICPLCRSLIENFTTLHKFNFCRREQAEIRKLEKKLQKCIAKQKFDINNINRLAWIQENVWKTVFGLIILNAITAGILLWS